MSKFRLNVYYNEVAVYQGSRADFSDVIKELNEVIGFIYEFNDDFGDHVFLTRDFSYVIEEA